LADYLDEATGQLRVELATQREAEAELEVLRSLAARFQDLVLDDADGLSSLAASMSTVVKELEIRIDIAAVPRPVPSSAVIVEL
jgi:hypothetical protein